MTLELAVIDPPEAWEALGFAVSDSRMRVGEVTFTLGADAFAWSLPTVDGLPNTKGSDPFTFGAAHPNGARSLDHLVVATPDLDRTLAALAAAGFDLRRTRDTELGGRPLRQAFYRLGEPILEVVGPVQPAGEGLAAFWGLTFTVADLDAAAELLGERLGDVHDAVQPGRRIASLRSAAGLRTRVAFMSQPATPPARV